MLFSLFIFLFVLAGCVGEADRDQPVVIEDPQMTMSEEEVEIDLVTDPFEERQGEEGLEDISVGEVEAALPEQEELPRAESSEGTSLLPVITDGSYLLALVTKDTMLKSEYVPPDLQPVPAFMHPYYEMQLRAEALAQLEALWMAAEAEGVILHIRSAYRSYSTQKGLFQDYASRHGEEQANRFSARPGQSEHQLGTAVDFGGTSVDFKASFAETPQGIWLAENAHRFGFALSYPRNKEDITGYIFEPWHYRYIGIDAAAEWRESGLTLKEYLENKPQYFD